MPASRISAALVVSSAAALTMSLAPLVASTPAAEAVSSRTATRLTLDATPDTLGQGEKTLVEGELFRDSDYAPIANRLIRLQSRRAWTSNAWSTYATVVTDSRGHYHHYRFADRSRAYRAVYTGSTVYQPTTSNAWTTTVTPGEWTRISGWVVSLSGKATLKGSLRRSSDGKVLAGQWVSIDRRKPWWLSWTKVGARKTATNGYFSFTDTRLVGECFVYRATYSGNSRFAGKSQRAIWKSC